MIAGFLSFFALLASFFRSHLGSVSLTLVSAVGSFSAGLCAMIALAVYTGEFAGAVNVAPGQVTFGWSYGLGWASFLLFLITDLINASRAFLILAVIAGLLSCLALLASFFCSHLGSVSLTLVSAVGSFSAGLCATVTMAVFTSQSTKTIMIPSAQVSFGWSFYVGWAACPLSLPANYIEATKMFLMLGLLAGLLSAFSLLALLRGSSFDTVSPFVVSAMGSFSAGFCILIALTVFTSEFAEVIKVG
ncbi:Protein NKG7 [Chelonia mydas]|uniref:Protein NKG7 n=1 Tax=Chelonia mydas TaxID=8469 RepID=M7AG31_CHEMY|nr:Protein NKG7 [Chelonia mydas]